MQWQQQTVLVTGANRGIGLALVDALIERGAKKIYITGRDKRAIEETARARNNARTELVPLQLDVTSSADIRRVKEEVTQLDILINNAGIAVASGFIQDNSPEIAQQEMATHFFGPMNLSRALLPALYRSPQAALVNVSSIAGIANMPVLGPYSAAKAALHSLTQGLRAELKSKGILVQGVYPGPVATRLSEGYDLPKPQPGDVAAIILQSIEQQREDVFPDALAQQWYAAFSRDPKSLEREFAAWVNA